MKAKFVLNINNSDTASLFLYPETRTERLMLLRINELKCVADVITCNKTLGHMARPEEKLDSIQIVFGHKENLTNEIS